MKRILLILVLIVTVFQGFSQTRGISYQAVILNPNPQQLPGQNAENNILANSAVAIQFTIVNASGTEEYQEQHTTQTDRYGMINLLIGTGSPTSSNDFADIFWNGTTKKLKVGIDFKGGSNFSALSEQNLTYMPQPPTEEVNFEILNNSEAIATEKTRALQAEQSNAGGITALQAEQTIQNTAIALNTAKVGITTVQATTISNTTGINTGDQDISGITINTTAILDEVTRAGLAETANATAISDEVTRATEAEQTNANNIVLKENAANKSIDGTLATNSDVLFPTEKAIKTYVDALEIATQTTLDGKVDNSQVLTNVPLGALFTDTQLTEAQVDAFANNNGYLTAFTEVDPIFTASEANNITAQNITDLSNLSGGNSGDQDISGIAINANAISTIQGVQTYKILLLI
jgi:hypothetical protein